MVGGIKRLTVQRLCHGYSIGTVEAAEEAESFLQGGFSFVAVQ